MSDWTYFLVRNLDPRLLQQIRVQAESEVRSLSDVMRQILCEHYSLDCPPSGAPTRLEHGARTQRLRIQPALWQAIKNDSDETGESMQLLIHEALESYYKEVVS